MGPVEECTISSVMLEPRVPEREPESNHRKHQTKLNGEMLQNNRSLTFKRAMGAERQGKTEH